MSFGFGYCTCFDLKLPTATGDCHHKLLKVSPWFLCFAASCSCFGHSFSLLIHCFFFFLRFRHAKLVMCEDFIAAVDGLDLQILVGGEGQNHVAQLIRRLDIEKKPKRAHRACVRQRLFIKLVLLGG